MKLAFFNFNYPPDLCAGSFRAAALVNELSKKLSTDDEIHVITTFPNRYSSYHVDVSKEVISGNIIIHRIETPAHKSGMLSQAWSFFVYAYRAILYAFKIKPTFLMCTTSRLMTGILTWFAALLLRKKYFIDIRDIFSETISDIFSLKSKILGYLCKSIFSFIEKIIFKNSAGVNVVSEGFLDYFQQAGINTTKWTCFSNGVDDEFTTIDINLKKKQQNEFITILYAGNIGSGQGLENILPGLATKLGDQFKIKVIGDGGMKTLLDDRISQENTSNIEIIAPMNRKNLIAQYLESDILFLHLNNLPAFKRVLPSKIFEYAALGKPIVAGLDGYSAKFVSENIKYGCVFLPCDIDSAVTCINSMCQIDVDIDDLTEFVEKFSRKKIMGEMSYHLLDVINKNTKNKVH